MTVYEKFLEFCKENNTSLWSLIDDHNEQARLEHSLLLTKKIEITITKEDLVCRKSLEEIFYPYLIDDGPASIGKITSGEEVYYISNEDWESHAWVLVSYTRKRMSVMQLLKHLPMTLRYETSNANKRPALIGGPSACG